ncbi:hypothetical protein WJX84_009610 [Apatococcus fuscideae]|uniref:BZIP domain-containing protein n=1 Tax=Apatococcus fuscideae TaxID=2026836 RepID=A0AAW1SR51_9CHLO
MLAQDREDGQEPTELDALHAFEPWLDSPRARPSCSDIQQPQSRHEVFTRRVSSRDPAASLEVAPSRLRPASGDLIAKRVLEHQRSQARSVVAPEGEGSGDGGLQKARERNKNAQRTFRQRQKVPRQEEGEQGKALLLAAIQASSSNLQLDRSRQSSLTGCGIEDNALAGLETS